MSVGSIILAGGGTGGHIAPGIAIAERLCEIAPTIPLRFACSTRPIDMRMLDSAGYHAEPIPAEGFSPRPAKLLRFARAFLAGRSVAHELLRTQNARCVISLGGFVTAPVVYAARSLKVPVFLVNLDATPGKANRWVAKRAQRIWSACETPGCPNFATRVVGMPIRRVAIAPMDGAQCRAQLGLHEGLRTLFVTGASQGAKSLNDLLMLMLKERRSAFSGWQVYHLVGGGERHAMEAAYRDAGVHAVVDSFLEKIGLAWGSADLALSRAGANSVAEAVANAVPTVFAPYPWHHDQHQKANAQPFVDARLARCEHDHIEAVPNLATLGSALQELLQDHQQRENMRDGLRALPQADAALEIAKTAAAIASGD
ncbi:MAG: UDP-N-acetylglucosamine--N-acetylmuramyl-(pentapeptide) pyrophosphoryl-undecaprenol N-acetylglucosamine transferase [Phycisphaerales bacterium]|nr:UDP-N-acetylglucosamine--N-acetylmuramyl-(pentapeptide) pyrophosphoryl-undecaprenol N-acetylglucosamine transferase [Phycisphaerales bacterium]